MTELSKVTFRGQSSCVVAESSFESDKLGPEEVLRIAKELANDAQAIASEMTMRMKI